HDHRGIRGDGAFGPQLFQRREAPLERRLWTRTPHYVLLGVAARVGCRHALPDRARLDEGDRARLGRCNGCGRTLPQALAGGIMGLLRRRPVTAQRIAYWKAA